MSIGGRGLLLQKMKNEEQSETPAPAPLGRGLLLRGRPQVGGGGDTSESILEALEKLDFSNDQAKPVVPAGMGRGILRGRNIPQPMEIQSVSDGRHDEGVDGSESILDALAKLDFSREQALPAVVPTGMGRGLLKGRAIPPPVETQSVEERHEGPRRSRYELQNVADESHGGHSQIPPGAKPISVVTNYLPIECSPGQIVYQYHVFFDPSMDSRAIRMKLLYSMNAAALNGVLSAARVFDGRVLYTPKPVGDSDEPFSVRMNDDFGKVFTLTFKLVAKAPLKSCRALLNVLFKRIQGTLKMVQVGRNYFQPKNKIDLKNLRLEVWPGYVASLAHYEGGLMLMCDVSHRVVRMETVYDLMTSLMSGSANKSTSQFQQAFCESVVGTSVLTRYNNRTYRVDDVAFGMSPLSTFKTADGEETTFARYYQQHYMITIEDTKQPLLISKCKVPRSCGAKPPGGGSKGTDSGIGRTTTAASSSSGSGSRLTRSSDREVRQLFLIPELCFQSGLNDAMRNNFQLMKSLHEHTRASPMTRFEALMKFAQNCRETPEAAAMLNAWDLTVSPTAQSVTGYQLPPERIVYGQSRSAPAGENAEFKRDIGRMPVIRAIPVVNWIYIYVDKDEKCADEFLNQLRERGRIMGMNISPPVIGRIENDRTDTYLQTVHKLVTRQTQLVVCLMRVAREDRYNAIKKELYVDLGIASQIVLCKTISDPRKLSSVATNIALQITAKLGGELWAVSVPFPKVMVIGMDTYHEGVGQSRRSVGGLVGSLNNELTRYYSQANFQAPGQEMIEVMCPFIGNLLKHFYDKNHFLPETVLIYRDGVSDGQLSEVQQVEVTKILQAFVAFARDFQPGYKPQVVFHVVQKRISTRLFGSAQSNQVANVNPGVIVDKVITRADAYDFFLVPQSVRQGTATPSHYIVVHDSSHLSPGNVQAMAFKSCHLYYNWPGTIRVPAACQYAHKLAYMVGCNLRAPPKENLRENLFYL